MEAAVTIPEDRPISSAEAELVRWLLRNAFDPEAAAPLIPTVGQLRVVGRCSCGCPSVDFEPQGQAAGAGPIAETLGETEGGVGVGVILWGRDGAVTGLELYELAEPVRELPQVQSLGMWPHT